MMKCHRCNKRESMFTVVKQWTVNGVMLDPEIYPVCIVCYSEEKRDTQDV